MSQNALVTIFCPDRPGLVAAITGHLFDLGANFADTSFAVMGAGAEFTAVCELPAEASLDAVAADLGRLPELAGAEVTVRPFALDTGHNQSATTTHEITISGGDQPGLIARLCEVLGGFGANIVTLNAGLDGQGANAPYTIRITAWIPQDKAPACLGTMMNTAQSLQLRCQWSQH